MEDTPNEIMLDKPNVDLLRDTLDYIEQHPEEWDQSTWATKKQATKNVCGTSFCFAGHAVNLSEQYRLVGSAYNWHTDEYEVVTTMEEADTQDRLSWFAQNVKTGNVESIATAARKVLNIGGNEGDYLFDGGNTLDQLDLYVTDIISGIASDEDYEGRYRNGDLVNIDD